MKRVIRGLRENCLERDDAEGETMFEFLKRHKIKDRAALRRSLLDRGHTGIPHHDGAEFDSVLSTIITQEMLSTDLSSHFEPGTDSSSFDPGSGFDGGGGMSGGGGADGDW